MLSWFDAASYTERARPGYEVLIELKALSWRYMNLCGMCRDHQHSAPVLVLANYRITNCDMHSVSLSMDHATCTRGHGSKSSSIVPTPKFHPSATLHTDRWVT